MFEQHVEGIHELGARAIIEGHNQLHAGVACGEAHALFNVEADGVGKLLGAPDDLEFNVVFVDGREFAGKIFTEETHQEIHFGLGAAPIFQGKRVQRQAGQFQAGAAFDDLASGLHAGAMPRDAREMAALRPSSIAIHDHGDMLGQTL